MTEESLRLLVREAIARQLGAARDAAPQAPGLRRPSHASHAMFVLPSGGDAEGPCLIEPSVMCNRCGYCKSFGH